MMIDVIFHNSSLSPILKVITRLQVEWRQAPQYQSSGCFGGRVSETCLCRADSCLAAPFFREWYPETRTLPIPAKF